MPPLSSGIISDCTASLPKAGNLHRQRCVNLRSVIYSRSLFLIISVSMSERNSCYCSQCECVQWQTFQSGHSHTQTKYSPSLVMLACSLNNCVFAKHMVTMFPGSCLRALVMDIITPYSAEVTARSMTINFQ